MDPRLLRLYNEELAYLREGAREFGEEHETVAARLGLKTPTDPDPYVERLLEGVAFLGARVQLKIKDQYPEFTQHLLHAVQPHYLAPTPSICITAFEPKEGDQELLQGRLVPRGTELIAPGVGPNSADTAITFKTAHDVRMWPLKIDKVEYLGSRASVAPYATAAGVRAEAGLKFRFIPTGGAKLSQLKVEQLSIYLGGSESVPGELYRQMAGETLAVIATNPKSADAGQWTRLDPPVQLGISEQEALLPPELRSFRGYRLLTEFFACPERLLFVGLNGLDRAFSTCDEECEVVLLFSRSSAILPGAIEPITFKLYATPAINMWEKQLGRVSVTPHEHEFHVIPDRTQPLDYEVIRILDVQAYAGDNVHSQPVAPLYAFGALLYDWSEALFYSTQLRWRRLTTREQRQRRRTDYIGTETWISLTAPGDASRLGQVSELAVRALVSNRELPEMLTFKGDQHFILSGIPTRAISVVRAPTKPRPPMGMGDSAWRLIAHLTPNFATLAPEDHDDPSVLRDHLALYGRQDDPALRRFIDGILSVRSEMVARRVPGLDRMAIARGQRIRIMLDDAAFDHSRKYLFAAVIERFLCEFASINSFTECIFSTAQEPDFAHWSPRIGRRPSI